MKISIITPSFNQAQFLEQTILSVISQNHPGLEYIIIDGGSKDKSVEIIKKYEGPLAYWLSEKDSGQSEAINKGLKKATGEIVGWLNSDDLYFPDTLKTVSEIFCENPDVDLIYGDVEDFYPDGKTKIYKNVFEPADFLTRVSIHQPSVFWRKKLHDKIGYLDESLHYLMDYDLWMRIFLNHKTLKTNKILSRFRIHDKSKTSSNPPQLYGEFRQIFSRFINSVGNRNIKKKLIDLNLYTNQQDINYNLNKNILTEIDILKTTKNYILNCGIQEYSFGNRKKSNQILLKSLETNIAKSLFLLIKNNVKALWD